MATQVQAAVTSVLGELGLEMQEGGVPGGPVTFTIPEAAIARLRETKEVVVDSDGTITVR